MSKLLPLLSLKALFMVFVILFAGIGLSPDEAQYYTWSRELSFGYYSKPPGIAWEIFLTTFFLGVSEFSVRFGPLIIGTLFPIAIFYLAKRATLDERGAFIAALFAAFSPIGFFATFLAITDGGMLLFWTFSLIEITKSISDEKEIKWERLGLWIALGALFKWPIYLLWGIVFIKERKISKGMILGFLISLLGLLPTLYWNATHDFVTFKHVFTIVSGGNDGGAAGNPLEFFASQGALLSPVIFVMFLWGAFKLNDQSLSKGALFLGRISYLLLSLFIIYSFFKKGQGNWCLFVYPSAFVFLAALFEKKKALVLCALLSSIVLVAGAFAIPSLPIPWKMNPFRHNLGWKNLGEKLSYDEDKEFLFSDKYQVVAELMFYGENQKEAYFFNLQNLRKNQYSFQSPPILQDGVFIAVEQEPKLSEKINNMKDAYPKTLAKYFKEVEAPLEMTIYEENGMAVKKALIIRCHGWSGQMPDNPEKY